MPEPKKKDSGVTKQVLKKELGIVERRLDAKIDGVEQRLDSKIDIATQSTKNYIDSRWKQLDAKFGARFDKMERYFEELVGMVVRQNKKVDKALDRIDNHEQRITRLEEKVA